MQISNSSNRAAAPKLFASVRGSRDLSLVAFGVALFTAFALHLGAFLPRVSAPGAHEETIAATPAATVPAAVAATPPVPCVLPRG